MKNQDNISKPERESEEKVNQPSKDSASKRESANENIKNTDRGRLPGETDSMREGEIEMNGGNAKEEE